jgi:2-hydroxychromene-2-carboxylate isomerase
LILESAVLDVKPGQEPEFEAAFAQARSILAAARGYVCHELRRSIERPSRYLLLVRWRSLEDHVEGFRKSAAYAQWKRLLHHFYDPFPTVEHYEVLGRGGVRPVVEFFFSPGSRYSYLAASQIAAIESETGCAVEWRPVNGIDIRALRGRDPFASEPVSGQYEWSYRRRDAELWAEFYGIPFREPPSRDLDFALLARAATAAKRLGAAASFGWRLCSAVYASDVWPIDGVHCVKLAEECGLAPDAFAAALDAPDTPRELSAMAEEAHRRGAFGVPTFFFGDRMFWGNDRITLLKHSLTKNPPS